MSSEAKPFLKWAGGKSSVIPQLKEYFPKELQEGKIKRYIEPFVGAGAVFFYLIERYEFEEIIINDNNKTLINTYESIKDNCNDLIKHIAIIQEKYNIKEASEQKELYLELRKTFNEIKVKELLNEQEKIQLASLMIVINKLCFNGLYRENKKGGFNVPFNNSKQLNIDFDNLQLVSEVLKNVKIMNYDFQDLECYADKDTFIYMDPPYRPLTQTSSFNDYSKIPFNDDEQIRLAECIKRMDTKKAKLLLSNSDPQSVNEEDLFFVDLYKEFKIERLQASRMINSKGSRRGKISELIIRNY